MRFKTWAIVAVLLALSGCAPDSGQSRAGVETPDGDAAFESLATGSISGCTQAGDWLIRNDADWAAFWTMIYSPYSEAPPRPEVDFASESVLATCMGSQGSSGYGTRFTAVAPVDVNGGVESWVEEVTPASEGCAYLTVITQPYEIVKVPGVVTESHVEHSQGVGGC